MSAREPDPWTKLLVSTFGAAADPGELLAGGDWLRNSGELEAAIVAYRAAVEQLSHSDASGAWARATAKLTNALLERRGSDPAANVEEAIALSLDALGRLAPTELKDVLYSRPGGVTLRLSPPEGVAELFHGLGDAYLRRLEGDREENLDVAVHAYQQALAYTDSESEPIDWAATAATLGNVVAVSPVGDRQDNVRRGVDLLRDAFVVFAEAGDAKRSAAAALNLSVALLKVEGPERAESVETAIALLEELLRIRSREVDLVGWASAASVLATAHMDAPEGIGAGPAKAAELYEEILEEPALQNNPVLRPEAFRNLSRAYRRLAGDDSEGVKRAARALRSAIDALPSGSQLGLRADALRELAGLHFDRRRWAQAEPVYADAIEVETRALETAVYEAGRRARLPAELHPRHAYCLLRRGRYDEALGQLEAGKTRLLALAVALTVAQLQSLDEDLRDAIADQDGTIRQLEELRDRERARGNHTTTIDDADFAAALAQSRGELARLLAEARERRPGLDLDVLSATEILALVPEDGALVAPLFTSAGSAVFVIPDGTETVTRSHVLWLDDFTEADLAALVEQISGADEEAIEAAAEAMWERFVGRIARRLRRVGARRVLLLPQGGLGLLPVHAACRSERGERRYLADDFEIRYAPSAYALDAARRRAHAAGSRTALVAGVGRSQRFGDLPSIDDEVEAVARLLGAEPLLNSDATPAEVVRRAGEAAYIHLACHGAFGWGADPLESALYLAGDEPLTLADVIGRLELGSTRLVALSACESGVVEASEAPDELFGLTAGFMQAGAAGVLSSLWTVDDLSTGLLMERFYRAHLEEDAEPVTALAEAQRWLRDVTREDVSRLLRKQGRRDESLDVLALGRREETPYAHPYHWAAFAYNGV
jgi:CHAT domain-containing protein